MFAIGQSIPESIAHGYFGPADVTEIREGVLYVKLPGASHVYQVSGVLTTSSLSDIHVGTRVLAAAQHLDDVYVIGVLQDAVSVETSQPPSIASNSSSSAAHAKSTTSAQEIVLSDQETTRVLSPERQLLFEHDPGNGRTRVLVPRGDLELVTEEGHIRLQAAGGIELQGHEQVTVRSETQVQLAVPTQAGDVHSQFAVNEHSQRMETPELRLATARLQGQATETQLTSLAVRGPVREGTCCGGHYRNGRGNHRAASQERIGLRFRFMACQGRTSDLSQRD